jgi:hypothetical protein
MVIDDVDELLSKTLMPAHTSKLSENGVWGLSDVRQYTTVPVSKVTKYIEDFYVEFITRWNKLIGEENANNI